MTPWRSFRRITGPPHCRPRDSLSPHARSLALVRVLLLACAPLLFSPTANALVDFTGVTELAVGAGHNCAVQAGSVRCWGDNTSGQLGDGTTLPHATPKPVGGLASATAVSLGVNHSCALLGDGTVRCWGANDSGQLGDGTLQPHAIPSEVSGLSGVAQISAGEYHTCALLTNGTVRCWGDNASGQLGDGTIEQRKSPVSAVGVTSALALSAGAAHVCVIVAGGTLKCWGNNSVGQFGNGTTVDSPLPVATPAAAGATWISAGDVHTCAVVGGGVKCWGQNSFGALGDGTTTQRLSPVDVIGVTGAMSVDADGYMACARLGSGSAKCWGYNVAGQLGDGTTATRLQPVDVTGIAAATKIYAGGIHTCALNADTSVDCWGSNFYGQLGTGSSGGFEPLPQTVQVEPGPAVGLSPGAVNFFEQTVAQTSPAQGVLLTNVGGEPLAITSIVPQGDFSVFHQCLATIAAGDHCTLSVTFTPTGLGPRTGSVTIVSNGAVSPVVLPLAGTGVASPTPRAAPLAYITHFGSSYVSVIDTAARKVIRTITVGTAPEGIVIAPNGGAVYVGNVLSNDVSIIDPVTLTATGTIGTGIAPRGLAVSPDGGRLYVAASESNAVFVIDTVRRQSLGGITVGNAPWGLALGGGGRKLYVANSEGDTVSVIDTSNPGVPLTIPVMDRPFGVVASPDGERIYVANFGSNSVSIVDTGTDAVVGTVFVDSGPFGLALSPDGSTLYVTTNQNTVSVVDTATMTKTGSLAAGNHPQGISILPDGNAAYVANQLDDSVSIVTLPSGPTETLELADGPVSFGAFIAPAVSTTPAVEYFHAGFGHYFVTADPAEIAGLDAGAYGGAWARTGLSFEVWDAPNPATSPVCRFFSAAFAPKSTHFYTPFATECTIVKADPHWLYESIAFELQIPIGFGTGSGQCPPGTAALYRLYNNFMGGAPNHRYTDSLPVVDAMVAAGWSFEGEASTKVFACIPR